MKTRQLLVTLALIVVPVMWSGYSSAAFISFIENPDDSVVPFVVVTTDIPGATITIANGGVETQTDTGGGGFASVSLGDVSAGTVAPPFTVAPFVAASLTQGGFNNMEGGGGGVSDIIDLFIFQSAAGAPVGFLATFRSDGTRGIPTAGEGIQTFLPETGALQLIFTGAVTLPGLGPVNLTVTAQSDVEKIPEPSTLALFGAALAAFAMRRRRPQHK